jgi:hypothetical protein
MNHKMPWLYWTTSYDEMKNETYEINIFASEILWKTTEHTVQRVLRIRQQLHSSSFFPFDQHQIILSLWGSVVVCLTFYTAYPVGKVSGDELLERNSSNLFSEKKNDLVNNFPHHSEFNLFVLEVAKTSCWRKFVDDCNFCDEGNFILMLLL